MAITIRDVAALAGVSPSTVSRVCNDHPSISLETRERVRSAMNTLGYEPSASAQPSDQRLTGHAAAQYTKIQIPVPLAEPSAVWRHQHRHVAVSRVRKAKQFL